MNRREKKMFVRTLIKTVQTGVLKKADEWPPEWDGIELRWLVADHFSNVVMKGIGNRKRRRDYNNEVMVKNLV